MKYVETWRNIPPKIAKAYSDIACGNIHLEMIEGNVSPSFIKLLGECSSKSLHASYDMCVTLLKL